MKPPEALETVFLTHTVARGALCFPRTHSTPFVEVVDLEISSVKI